MTYIFLWLICSVSSFYLLKNYVSSNLRLVGIPDASIATAMRNAAKKDDSGALSYSRIPNVVDPRVEKVFWVVILAINLLMWPAVICILLWCRINKQDFSIFRGLE